MSKKDLKSFNPDKVAEIELKMWKAYYGHNFLKLFFLLIQLVHRSFHIGYILSARVTYYAAFAAADFRMNKGEENKERILKNLVKFYGIVSRHITQPFDYKKVAELELEWWMVDRYPDRYKTSRESALALEMATIYNVDVSKLAEYAQYRAKAMVLYDEAISMEQEVDWDAIGSLLQTAFRSLYQNIE